MSEHQHDPGLCRFCDGPVSNSPISIIAHLSCLSMAVEALEAEMGFRPTPTIDVYKGKIVRCASKHGYETDVPEDGRYVPARPAKESS